MLRSCALSQRLCAAGDKAGAVRERHCKMPLAARPLLLLLRGPEAVWQFNREHLL
jgi:hypothetical protein